MLFLLAASLAVIAGCSKSTDSSLPSRPAPKK